MTAFGCYDGAMRTNAEKLSDLLPRDSYGHDVEGCAYLMRRLRDVLAADPDSLRNATDEELRAVVGIVSAAADALDHADSEISVLKDAVNEARCGTEF